MATTKKYKVGDIRNGCVVLPPQQRKTILFISDLHIRQSGLGSQKKQIIYGTCHRYNFIDLGYIEGSSILKQYPVQDYSKVVQQQTGVQDAKVLLKVFDFYGAYQPQHKSQVQSRFMRYIDQFKPDALFHFTDPHSWFWLYQIQNFVRSKLPIIYYSIWDNMPYPKYNQPMYACSDLIMNISKQTHNITNCISVNFPRQDWQTKYVAHGINTQQFRPLSKRNSHYKNMAQKLQRDKYDFILLFVNKNLERKQTALLMEAWKWFNLNFLTQQQRERSLFLLKTDPFYSGGLPLETFREHTIHDGVNIKFLNVGMNQDQLNALYNCADALISGSNAQGFGLSTAQGLAAGKPFISTVVGGLQDQMGFYSQDGTLYMNNPKLPTNCFKTIQKSSPWCIPVWTTATSYIGSPGTPYITAPAASAQSFTYAMKQMYQLGDQKRRQYGLLGRLWMHKQQVKMTASWMAQSMMQNIDQMFQNWKPLNQYRMYTAKPIKVDGLSGMYDPIKKEWY